jgi:phage gp36-like protein
VSVVYATLDEFQALGLPPGALVGLAEADILRALRAASARATSYLGQRYRLPLVAWGDDLRIAVAWMAAWALLSRRGFNPEAGADVAVRKNYEDAVGWLRDVARGGLDPTDVEDSSPAVLEDAAVVLTEDRRGW